MKNKLSKTSVAVVLSFLVYQLAWSAEIEFSSSTREWTYDNNTICCYEDVSVNIILKLDETVLPEPNSIFGFQFANFVIDLGVIVSIDAQNTFTISGPIPAQDIFPSSAYVGRGEPPFDEHFVVVIDMFGSGFINPEQSEVEFGKYPGSTYRLIQMAIALQQTSDIPGFSDPPRAYEISDVLAEINLDDPGLYTYADLHFKRIDSPPDMSHPEFVVFGGTIASIIENDFPQDAFQIPFASYKILYGLFVFLSLIAIRVGNLTNAGIPPASLAGHSNAARFRANAAKR